MPIGFLSCKETATPTGKSIGIVGAGPAGLAAAGVLVCKGYEVHVYDNQPEPGGMLIFAIPEFRIPKDRVRHSIGELREKGVVFHQNITVGKDITVGELLEKHDVVIIATGTWKGRELHIPGIDLPGVYNALDWIYHYMKHKLGYEAEPPPILKGRVAVIGAGLTAVDIAELTKLDFNATPIIVYRRPINISPARFIVKHLKKIGVEFIECAQPVAVLGKEKVEELRLVRTKPTKSRKEHVETIPGTEFEIRVDAVVQAIGLRATPPESLQSLGVEFNPNGTVKVNENGMTTVPRLFAAGDVAQGPSNIGLAIKSGRKTAEGVDRYLSGA